MERHHRARAAELEGITERAPTARVALAVERVRRHGRKDPAPRSPRAPATPGDPALTRLVRSELAAIDYRADSKSQRPVPVLRAAAWALLETGAWAESLGFAEHLERIGTRDSLALTRSAIVGEALLLGARARLGQGDTAAARASLARAIAPLEAGLGVRHPLTMAAAALGDSLRR
jgi:hypothetical protein